MSTILKTLKKLEEEKSVLDHPLSIEGMVTQEIIGRDSYFSRMPRKLSWIAGLIIITAFLFLGWYYFEPKAKPQPRPSQSFPQKPIIVVPKDVEPKITTFPGIPMARISERKISDPPLLESKPSQSSPINDILPILETQPENLPAKEISALLKEVQIKASEEETKIKKPVTRTNGHIPGLSIKGIIFFSKGNPANYIFAATPKSSSQKFKAGDKVQGATLESIHTDHVIFKKQGSLVSVGMGN